MKIRTKLDYNTTLITKFCHLTVWFSKFQLITEKVNGLMYLLQVKWPIPGVPVARSN